MSVSTIPSSDKQVIELLRDGQIGVMPTDTLYGLVAAASLPAAVERLYTVKRRGQKPGTIIAANIGQLVELGLKKRYLEAVSHFWPNPISVVIPTGTPLSYVHDGVGSLAVRIPDDMELRTVLERSGPLVTTSANLSGEKPANTIDAAQRYFGDAVDFYVDGSDLSGRLPSTVIRVVDDIVEVLRVGAAIIDEAGNIVEIRRNT